MSRASFLLLLLIAQASASNNTTNATNETNETNETNQTNQTNQTNETSANATACGIESLATLEGIADGNQTLSDLPQECHECMSDANDTCGCYDSALCDAVDDCEVDGDECVAVMDNTTTTTTTTSAAGDNETTTTNSAGDNETTTTNSADDNATTTTNSADDNATTTTNSADTTTVGSTGKTIVRVKGKATFEAPLNLTAQGQVKDAYCQAVSSASNVVANWTCNISETAGPVRRLLAATSYDLSATAETTAEQASVIESDTNLQTAVETTFTADSSVVAANGGSAPTVEVEAPEVETVVDTTTTEGVGTTDVIAFTEEPDNSSAFSISCGLLMLVALFTL